MSDVNPFFVVTPQMTVIAFLAWWGSVAAIILLDRRHRIKKAHAEGGCWPDTVVWPYFVFGFFCGGFVLPVYFFSTREQNKGGALVLGILFSLLCFAVTSGVGAGAAAVAARLEARAATEDVDPSTISEALEGFDCGDGNEARYCLALQAFVQAGPAFPQPAPLAGITRVRYGGSGRFHERDEIGALVIGPGGVEFGQLLLPGVHGAVGSPEYVRQEEAFFALVRAGVPVPADNPVRLAVAQMGQVPANLRPASILGRSLVFEEGVEGARVFVRDVGPALVVVHTIGSQVVLVGIFPKT